MRAAPGQGEANPEADQTEDKKGEPPTPAKKKKQCSRNENCRPQLSQNVQTR
jgi:hypothetical protein